MLILGRKDDSAEYTLGIKVLGIKGSKHWFPQHPTHIFDFNCVEASSSIVETIQGFNHAGRESKGRNQKETEPLLSKQMSASDASEKLGILFPLFSYFW